MRLRSGYSYIHVSANPADSETESEDEYELIQDPLPQPCNCCFLCSEYPDCAPTRLNNTCKLIPRVSIHPLWLCHVCKECPQYPKCRYGGPGMPLYYNH